MNAKQKKQVKDWISQLEEIQNNMETMSIEENEKYDNLPEGIQDSERGDAISEAADTLDEAASSIEEIIFSLKEITD